jgi:hypothetical protein
MQRVMFWVFVVWPCVVCLGVIVLKEPRMPVNSQKTQQIAELRSDRYEDAPDPTTESQAVTPITPPARYNTYLNSTKKLANRHRKLRNKLNKYTNNKDTKHVKQPGPTH